MAWFPVDDRFHSHPKAAAVSLAAIGLWAVAGSWAKGQPSNGDIPEHMITSLSRGATELADELVTAGLWRRTKAGYRFHQWSERNPTRSEALASLAKKSSGGRLGNHRRWHTGRVGRSDPDCEYCGAEQQKPKSRSDRISDRSTDTGTDRYPNPPIQSNPDIKHTPPDGGETDLFDEFWTVYPRKKAKVAARKAYAAAVKRGTDPEEILAGAVDYRDECRREKTQDRYIAHATTWLNQGRWNDLLEIRVGPDVTVWPWER